MSQFFFKNSDFPLAIRPECGIIGRMKNIVSNLMLISKFTAGVSLSVRTATLLYAFIAPATYYESEVKE